MFEPEPNTSNLNLWFGFRFTKYLNRTSRCRFRFRLMTPEPEPNRTPASLSYTSGKHEIAYSGLMVLIWLKFENKQIKIKPHFLLNFCSQLSISKKLSILMVIFFYKSHMPALNMPKFPYPACCQCLLVTTTNVTHSVGNYKPLSDLT